MFKQTGYLRYIYRNELDKACFQYDIAHGDFKDLAKRTAADKVLNNKVFNIAKDRRYDGYQRGLPSMVYKFFDKKTGDSGVKTIARNEKLSDKVHKPIIMKFKKRKSILNIQ